jgi:hypothetical protein
VGLFAWLLYWAVDGGLSVVERIGSVDIHSATVAWWFAFGWLALMVLGYAPTASGRLAVSLYPAAGLHSRFLDVARFKRNELLLRALGTAGVAVAATALGFLFDLPGVDAGTALLFSLAIAASLFATPESAADERDVSSTVRAFEVNGWTVLPSPRTGDAAIDPLLADVDLFAWKGSQAVLVDVKRTNGMPASAYWTSCAGLVTASRVLPRSQLPAGIADLDTVMFVLGAKLEREVESFASQQDVSIVVIDPETRTASVDGPPRLRDALEKVATRVLVRPGRASRLEHAEEVAS